MLIVGWVKQRETHRNVQYVSDMVGYAVLHPPYFCRHLSENFVDRVVES